jgi:hypothetical protein
MGVSLTTVKAFRAAHHDAIHPRDEGLIRLPDPGIAEKAVAERNVPTFDLDFGDIRAAARNTAPSVVIFRLRNQTPARGYSTPLSGHRGLCSGTRNRRGRDRRGRWIPRPAPANPALTANWPLNGTSSARCLKQTFPE